MSVLLVPELCQFYLCLICVNFTSALVVSVLLVPYCVSITCALGVSVLIVPYLCQFY